MPAISLPTYRSSLIRHYTSLAVGLLGAIALVVPSGYSVGAVLLVIGSLFLMVTGPKQRLEGRDWAVIGVLSVYALIDMGEAWWDAQGVSGLDSPVRFLLAVPAMLLVMAYPPRLSWVWGGLAIGALGAGTWAGWQKLVEGAWRATGHTHVIQFGNLSMLMGVLCLAGLGWAAAQPHRRAWLAFLALGALAGILGSLFSGSRGGWVGFPFVLLVLYRGYGTHLSSGVKVAVVGGGLVAASLVYALPQTGVQPRVHQAVDDVARYISGESQTSSLGARFEMWKGASHLILEKPLVGWGDNGYQRGMQALADQGVIHPWVTRFDHAHNEFIDTTAKRGIIGLVSLLALYLVPMRLFGRHLDAPDLRMRSLAVGGVLLCVAYIDFGLSQAFLTHNSGVMMFAFWLAVFWGLAVNRAASRQISHD